MEKFYLLQIDLKSMKQLLILLLFVLVNILACSSLRPSSVVDSFINYPNPFDSRNEFTTYQVKLKSTEIIKAEVSIFEEDGSLVSRLLLLINETNKSQAQVNWRGLDDDGKYLASGVYFARLNITDSNGFIEVKEIKTLLK